MGNKVKKFQEKINMGKTLTHREENLMELLKRNGESRRVYICAPYEGYCFRNRDKMWYYCMLAKDCGCVPIAPYYYYPDFWNMEDSRERQRLRSISIGEQRFCDEVWAFGEKTTPEMELQLHFAARRGLMIHYLPDWDDMKDLLPEGDDDDE